MAQLGPKLALTWPEMGNWLPMYNFRQLLDNFGASLWSTRATSPDIWRATFRQLSGKLILRDFTGLEQAADMPSRPLHLDHRSDPAPQRMPLMCFSCPACLLMFLPAFDALRSKLANVGQICPDGLARLCPIPESVRPNWVSFRHRHNRSKSCDFRALQT